MFGGMLSGEQCCKACHEWHGSGGLDVFKCIVVCCLVSSAAKPAMNGTEVVLYKSKCAHHVALDRY